MKSSFFVAAFVAFLVLCGCSGFTTDPPVSHKTDDGVVDYELDNHKAFAVARSYSVGSYEVTEGSDTSSTGVISMFFVRESGCVKDGETYQWVSNLNYVSQPDGGLFRFSFAGDTLLLTALNGESDSYGNVTVLKYVGGEPGKLRGIWRQLGRTAYTMYWNFGDGSIEIRIAQTENFNYMQSIFTWNLYSALKDSFVSVGADEIFYHDGFDASQYGVEIKSQTNTSEVFVHDGVTYDLKIDSVLADDYLSLTLSVGNSECHLEYLGTFNVTLEMCKAENADYFKVGTENMVSGYFRGNEKEFNECVQQLVNGAVPATTDSADGLSDATTEKSELEKSFDAAPARLMVYIQYSDQADSINEGTIYRGVRSEGRCMKDGDGVKWIEGDAWMEGLQLFGGDTIQYRFSGDSLMIVRDSSRTEVWVGGTPGKLEGIWKASDVVYKNGVSQIVPMPAIVYLKIDGDMMTMAEEMNPDFNFMETELADELHSVLSGEGSSVNFEHAFYEGESDLHGVAVLSQTNSSEVVSVNGKTYEVSVNALALWRDVSITVKSGSQTCSGRTVQIEQFPQEMCSAENAEYLKDFEGIGTIAYIIDEEKAFSECLVQMRDSQ